jgi:hypothetical protein
MTARKTLLVTAALAAAFATPAAYAGGPDDQAGTRGPGAIEQAQSSTLPDDRAVHGAGAAAIESGSGVVGRTDLRSPDTIDIASRSGTVTATTTAGSGFDWNDALIGGLAGIGTALLATGCFLVLMSRRNTSRYA